MRKERTPEQLARDAERLQRMQTPVEDVPKSGETPTIAAPLTVMLGLGEDLSIAGKTWHLAPFTTKHERTGFELLQQCPAVLLSLALTGAPDMPVDVYEATETFNRLTGRVGVSAELMPFSESDFASALANLPVVLSDEMIETMYAPVLLALRRHHPDVTRQDLEDDFDLGTFVRCVRAIYRVNTGLKNSF